MSTFTVSDIIRNMKLRCARGRRRCDESGKEDVNVQSAGCEVPGSGAPRGRVPGRGDSEGNGDAFGVVAASAGAGLGVKGDSAVDAAEVSKQAGTATG